VVLCPTGTAEWTGRRLRVTGRGVMDAGWKVKGDEKNVDEKAKPVDKDGE
jgi:hypothetical protein